MMSMVEVPASASALAVAAGRSPERVNRIGVWSGPAANAPALTASEKVPPLTNAASSKEPRRAAILAEVSNRSVPAMRSTVTPAVVNDVVTAAAMAPVPPNTTTVSAPRRVISVAVAVDRAVGLVSNNGASRSAANAAPDSASGKSAALASTTTSDDGHPVRDTAVAVVIRSAPASRNVGGVGWRVIGG
jgi:hypothetical protein